MAIKQERISQIDTRADSKPLQD